MNSGIYKISFGQKFYIGSSRNLKRRRSDHKRNFLLGKNSVRLQEAYWENDSEWVFEILEFVSLDLLLLKEQYYIDLFFGNIYFLNTSSVALAPGIKNSSKKISRTETYRTERKSRRDKSSSIKIEKTDNKFIRVTLKCGKILEFTMITETAKYFNISKHLIITWLNGHAKCPALSGKTKYDKTEIDGAMFEYIYR